MRALEGWASTPEVDRMGDIVLPKGAEYKLPIPFLLDHDHSQVVGEVDRVEVSDKGIKFFAHIAKIAEEGDAKRARRQGVELHQERFAESCFDRLSAARI
jgi:hypothetical protein